MIAAAQLLVPVLMWAGGAIMFGYFVKALRLRILMRRWPAIRGVVREHRVHSQRNRHGAGHHRPVVFVEYSVAGRKRLVRCDSPTRLGFASEHATRATMDRFAIGKEVDIYVDPEAPDRALLYPPETAALLLLSLGSLFLFIVGAGIFRGAGINV